MSHFISEYELKPNTKYTVNGYSYEIDILGRIKSAKGKLSLGEGSRNSKHQLKAVGSNRIKGDHGGHLIGTRFNGSPLVDNIVAMNGNVNSQ